MWVVSYCNQMIWYIFLSYYPVIFSLFTSANAFDTYWYFVATLIGSVITAALVTVVVVIVVKALEELLITMVLLMAERGSDLSNSSVTGVVLPHHDIANDNSRGNGNGGSGDCIDTGIGNVMTTVNASDTSMISIVTFCLSHQQHHCCYHQQCQNQHQCCDPTVGT